ncbi:hypothetical protein L316_17968 [Escherichia coli SHECO002]|nr:hypothetical protein L316_17968 [Escherichia coli SHECO002]
MVSLVKNQTVSLSKESSALSQKKKIGHYHFKE